MAKMGRPPKPDMTQISVRIPKVWLERAEAIATHLAPQGFGTDRVGVIRAAIDRGLAVLESEHGLAAKPKTKR